MTPRFPAPTASAPPDAGLPEIELTDADILDAMQHIPGYLDITTDDFRAVFHLAHRHAVDRLLGGLVAGRLMRSVPTPLTPDMRLDEAARTIAASGCKGLPVVDADRRVVGILTETDFLRCLEAGTFLDLLAKVLDESFAVSGRCRETRSGEAMTAPATTVVEDAGVHEIVAGFARHPGRSMPVVDGSGRLRGLLLRKDFLTAVARAGQR